jgi:O-antigen/teichoic acid export membrane protein
MPMFEVIKNGVLKNYNNNREMTHNYVWRTLQVFGKQGTSFIIFLIATRFLSIPDMGVYNYVISFMTLLVIFADLGISTATSKYVAEYSVTSEKKLRRVLFNSGLLILLLSLITTVITLIWGEQWLGENYQYLLVALPLLFLSPLSSLYDGIYRGERRFKQLAVYSIVVGIIATVIAIPVISRWGLEGAIISQNILYAIFVVVVGLGYRNFELKFEKKVLQDIFKYSLAYGIATIGFYLFSRVNLIIMGNYGYFEEIAHYELLNKVMYIFLLPFTILGQVLAPYVTQTFAKGDYVGVLKSYKRAVVIMLGLSVLFFLSMLVIAPVGVKFFAPEYYGVTMWQLLLPMSIMYTQLVFSAPINSGIIVSTGYAGISTWLNIVTGVINVVLSIILIQMLGYLGGVYAILLSQGVSLVVLNVIYYRKITLLVKKYEES